MKTKILEIFGWYGAFAILLAYGLVSFELLLPTSLMYILLNATGSLGIILISLSKKVYQPAFLNLVWLLIALLALTRLMFI